MRVSRQIRIGAVMSYISIAINILAALIYTPWMIAQIGTSDYGIYTLANSLITLFMVDFGLGFTTSRYVSKYLAEGKEHEVGRFLGSIFKLFFILDLLLCIAFTIVFFCIDTIYQGLSSEEMHKFRMVYLIAAGYSLIKFPSMPFDGILTSYEKFIQLKFADVVHRILIIVLMVMALSLGYGLYALVTVNSVAGVIVMLYKGAIIKKLGIQIDFAYFDSRIFVEVFKFSFWTTVSMLAGRLVFNISPSILGAVSSSQQISIFGIVSTIESYVYTLTTAINGIFLPTITRLFTDGKQETAINELAVKVGKFQFGVNSLLIIGFLLIGKQFIKLWVGAEFADAYYGILLVIIPGLFYNSLQIANTSLVVLNKVNISALIALITGIINVVCSLFLSRIYGAVGACIAICIAYSVRAVVTNIISGTIVKFNMKQFIKKCYVVMGLPTILCIIIWGFILTAFEVHDSWLSLFVEAILISISFICLVYIFGLDIEEKTALKKALRRTK